MVHSENETDNAKRGVRACTLDLILDLVPAGPLPVHPRTPASTTTGAEADSLRVVALQEGWRAQFVTSLRKTAFLAI
jgi:hypothetical protein